MQRGLPIEEHDIAGHELAADHIPDLQAHLPHVGVPRIALYAVLRDHKLRGAGAASSATPASLAQTHGGRRAAALRQSEELAGTNATPRIPWTRRGGRRGEGGEGGEKKA